VSIVDPRNYSGYIANRDQTGQSENYDHVMRIQVEALEYDKAECVLEIGIRDSEGEIVGHTTSVHQVRVLKI
jgi:hypothetical protein